MTPEFFSPTVPASELQRLSTAVSASRRVSTAGGVGRVSKKIPNALSGRDNAARPLLKAGRRRPKRLGLLT